ncbi:MAG: putative ankyrin repeat protein [Candidatus Midichloriaceae bacterium]|jgi:hypothetical protein|nr:putative ankyrin repeat protein [Candidatus Midichloriaceae bacterium]
MSQSKLREQLWGAINQRNVEQVKHLLNSKWIWLNPLKNADLTAVDENGQTALHRACDYYKVTTDELVEIVKLLLKDGRFDSGAVNKDGQTALHYACLTGKAPVVDLLLKDGRVDPNSVDKFGQTSLHCAANKGSVVRFLLKDGRVDVNAVDKNDEAALHKACGLASVEVINLFLAVKGINLDLPNKDGKTPLDILAEHRYIKPEEKEQIIKAFESAKASAIEANDPAMNSPLDGGVVVEEGTLVGGDQPGNHNADFTG